MATIKQPILDVMTRIREELTQFKTVRIWNNQTRHEAEGQYLAYLKPAVFVQVLNNAEWQALQGGVSSADLAFIFHIVHEYYDAQDGTFEQDLVVFDLRDAIIEKFTLFKPTGCGPMSLVSDQQDDEHTNIYVYQVGFVTHFIDTAGQKQYIQKEPPTEAQVNGQFVAPKNYMIIP